MKPLIHLYQGQGIGPELFEALRFFFLLFEPYVQFQRITGSAEIDLLPPARLLLSGPLSHPRSLSADATLMTVHPSSTAASVSRIVCVSSQTQLQPVYQRFLNSDQPSVLVHNMPEDSAEWTGYMKKWASLAFTPEGIKLEDADIYTFIRQGRYTTSTQVLTGPLHDKLLNALYASEHGSYTKAFSLLVSSGGVTAFPLHGTAADITGMGIANPIPLLLAFCALLKEAGLPEIAQPVENQIKKGLIEYPEYCTPDLGGVWNTEKYIRMISESVNLHAGL